MVLNFDEELKRAMKLAARSMEKRTAVCMMKDYPDLEERFKFLKRQVEVFQEKKKKMDEEFDDLRRDFWQQFEKALVDHGLLTKKEVRDFNLCLEDGVVFKIEENTDG